MPSLDSALDPAKLVDLTQPLGPDTILWPGTPPFRADVDADYDRDGGYARTLHLSEHSGTHLDAPAHLDRHGATTDALPLASLVRPAVRLDVRAVVGDDPAAVVSAADVEALEAEDGEIPAGSAVLVHTGWDRFRSDPERYAGPGGGPHFPGLGGDAAELLLARRVVGVGIDTMGIDPGRSADLAAHRALLPAGVWQLEGLVELERVPRRGAWLVVAPLPLVAGSGSPARVFAVLP